MSKDELYSEANRISSYYSETQKKIKEFMFSADQRLRDEEIFEITITTDLIKIESTRYGAYFSVSPDQNDKKTAVTKFYFKEIEIKEISDVLSYRDDLESITASALYLEEIEDDILYFFKEMRKMTKNMKKLKSKIDKS